MPNLAMMEKKDITTSDVSRKNHTGSHTSPRRSMEQYAGLSFDDTFAGYCYSMPTRSDALGYTQGNNTSEIVPTNENVVQKQDYPKYLRNTEQLDSIISDADSSNSLNGEIKVMLKEKIARKIVDPNNKVVDGAIFTDNDHMYFLNEEHEKKFKMYIRQVVDTFLICKELLYVTYPPNEYIIQDRKLHKEGANDIDIRNCFYSTRPPGKRNFNLNNGILSEYMDLIIEFLSLDPNYSGNPNPANISKEYKMIGPVNSRQIEQVPKNNTDTYCLYRSMRENEVANLEKYFTIKDEIETLITSQNSKDKSIDSFISDRYRDKPEAKARASLIAQIKEKWDLFFPKNLTNELKPEEKLPVKSHLGNLTQAVYYAGVLVKFNIKPDKAHLLAKDYLADGGTIKGGGEGNVSVDNKIGIKKEQSGKAFSYNLGKSFWRSVLFLSTVQSYQVYRLRKAEEGQTPDNYMPFDFQAYHRHI